MAPTAASAHRGRGRSSLGATVVWLAGVCTVSAHAASPTGEARPVTVATVATATTVSRVEAGGLGAFGLRGGDKRSAAVDTDTPSTLIDGDPPAARNPLALDVGSLAFRTMSEPSDLALLGDGLLVLIAWLAARQLRRARSRTAMGDGGQAGAR